MPEVASDSVRQLGEPAHVANNRTLEVVFAAGGGLRVFTVKLAKLRAMWQDLGNEHDVQPLTRLPLSG